MAGRWKCLSTNKGAARSCLVAVALLVAGQFLASIASAQALSPAEIQQQLAAVEKSTSLSDEQKTAIRELYQKALKELESTAAEAAKLDRFASASQSVPEDLGRARYDLLVLSDQPAEEISPEASLASLEERLAEAEAELAERQQELERLNEEPKRRATRRRDLPQKRVTLRKQLDRVQRDLEKQPDAAEPEELTLARKQSLLAQKSALERAIEAGVSELDSYQATVDLLPLQRDLAAARVARLQETVKAFKAVLKQRRRREVAAHLESATEDAAEYADTPLLATRAGVNLSLVERRRELRELNEQVTQDLAATSAVAASLDQQEKRIKHKVKAVELTGAIGLLMRKQKALLPRVGDYQREVRLRQKTLKSAQLAALELEDRRADLANLDEEIARLRARAAANGLPELTPEQSDQLRRLLLDERRYTDYLIEDSNAYVDGLLQLDQAQNNLIQDTRQFTNYIDENVLWVRSAETLSAADLPVAWSTLQQFISNGLAGEALEALKFDARAHTLLYGLVVIALLLARVIGWRMTIRHAQPHPIEERPTRLGRIVRDLIRVVLCAAPLPLFVGFLGLRLTGVASQLGYAQAVGAGLVGMSMSFLPLAILTRMCRARGFARRHLGWTAEGIAKIRRMLFVLLLVVLPLTFVTSTLIAQENVRWQDSLGRLCFIANVLLVGVFVERFLRPNTGVLFQSVKPEKGDVLSRIRWPAYLIGVGVHLALAILAIVGYTYAADRLGQEVRATAMLLTCLLLVGSVLLRWSYLIGRRRVIQGIAQQRAAQADALVAETPAGVASFAKPDTGDGWFVQSEESGGKMESLVTTILVLTAVVGSWLIWVDVVPALSVVNRVQVWESEVVSYQGVVPTTNNRLPGSPTAESSPAPVRAVPTLAPVMLGDVLLACFIVFSTIVAARYLAGLFELPVLDRLPLDSALRNTITTVTKYVLWIVAIIFAAGLLGISWGKVQWMAAAISLGLGFGLQEIFANFISGLIILFERPMRVGDVITIGDTTGVVQAIKMRATTITDWDRKELVVPNKEFATGRLLNWTLTNKTNRRVIEVGVAYGSDPDQVRELLLKIAADNARVLATPKPIALMKEFGTSAMIFSLRVYHARISDRLRGLHELNAAIAREFAAAGIRVAFPQLDLHVKTPPEPLSWFGPAEEEEEHAGEHPPESGQ